VLRRSRSVRPVRVPTRPDTGAFRRVAGQDGCAGQNQCADRPGVAYQAGCEGAHDGASWSDLGLDRQTETADLSGRLAVRSSKSPLLFRNGSCSTAREDQQRRLASASLFRPEQTVAKPKRTFRAFGRFSLIAAFATMQFVSVGPAANAKAVPPLGSSLGSSQSSFRGSSHVALSSTTPLLSIPSKHVVHRIMTLSSQTKTPWVSANTVQTNSVQTQFDPPGSTGTTDLSVSIKNESVSYVPGREVSYLIIAMNKGAFAVNGALVSSLKSDFRAIRWTCTATSGSICPPDGRGALRQRVYLAPGGSARFTLVGSIPAAAVGNVVQTAAVATPANVVDSDLRNNTASKTNTLLPTADLAIGVSDEVKVQSAGSSSLYTIKVSNNGPSDVRSAGVSNVLPANFVSSRWKCIASAGAACGTATGTGVLSTTVDIPVGGFVTLKQFGQISSAAEGSLQTNSQVMIPAGVVDPQLDNNTATDIDALGDRAELSITHEHTGVVVPGMPVTYKIVARNAGPADARKVQVTNILPAGMTDATWKCSASAGATCPASGTGDVNETVDLASGSSVAYLITANVAENSAGELRSVARVTPPTSHDHSTPTDTFASDNSATDIAAWAPRSDVAISLKAISAQSVTGVVTYSVEVTNAGPSTANGVFITHDLPDGVQNADWTCKPSAGSSCSPTGHGNVRDYSVLPVGGAVTYSVTAKTANGLADTLDIGGAVTAPLGFVDPVHFNNSGRIQISSVRSEPLPRSQPNPVELALASPTTFAPSSSSTSTTTIAPTTIAPTTKPTTTIAPTTVGFESPVAPDTRSAGSTSLPAERSLLNNLTPVSGDAERADLGVTMTDNVATVAAGGAVTYSIVIVNAGPSTANGAIVNNALPPELIGTSWTCAATAGASCTARGSGPIKDSIQLPPGGIVSYTVSGIVLPGATRPIRHSVTVTPPAGMIDPNVSNNMAADSDGVTAAQP
jgi:uncharacterized repeat protein (TIGR01451 family)